MIYSRRDLQSTELLPSYDDHVQRDVIGAICIITVDGIAMIITRSLYVVGVSTNLRSTGAFYVSIAACSSFSLSLSLSAKNHFCILRRLPEGFS